MATATLVFVVLAFMVSAGSLGLYIWDRQRAARIEKAIVDTSVTSEQTLLTVAESREIALRVESLGHLTQRQTYLEKALYAVSLMKPLVDAPDNRQVFEQWNQSRALLISSLRMLPKENLPHCGDLAALDQPWAVKNQIAAYVMQAENELHRALGSN